MLKQRILEDLKRAVLDLGYPSADIVLSIPKNSGFGDYTTNLALQLAKLDGDKLKQSPEAIANKLVVRIKNQESSKEYLEKVEAVSGFINFFLKPDALLGSLHKVCDYSSFVNPDIEVTEAHGKKILVEYASFNALKPVHVGHLRNITLGESIVRLLEALGNEVFKVTYTSDIGLPVAKTLWGIEQLKKDYEKAKKASLSEKAQFLGEAYVKGSSVYDENEKAREEIQILNTSIYQVNPKIIKLYQEVISWSREYFDTIYQKLGTKFDTEILESEVAELGKKIVLDNLGKVFKEDQGAIIFPGSEHGLHNRVFISFAGNPTYEAKDMGLAEVEYSVFPFDLAIHVVANDQDEYFKVVFKALEQLNPDLAKKERHLSYGYVLLPSGKMASRKGNVVTLEEVYDGVRKKVEEVMKQSPTSREINKEEKQQVIDTVSIGAIKFAILKFAPRTDITFDLEKSVSLRGDSGPYLQYAYTRAKSVLRNAQFDYQVDLPHAEKHPKGIKHDLEKEEREILRKIEHFEDIVLDCAENYSPNTLATYLLELASSFNLFYQKYPIIKSEEKSEVRLALTCCVAVVLKQGLNLLGIEVPERM